MPFCNKCGTEVPENVNFCQKCGNALQGEHGTSSDNAQSIQTENLSLWEYYIKSLKNYATFKGRARRKEFWGFILFNIIISFGLLFVGRILGDEKFGTLVGYLYGLGVLLPSWAVGVRRLHDVGKNGSLWISLSIGNYVLMALGISYVGRNISFSDNVAILFLLLLLGLTIVGIYVLYLLCKDSDLTENKYGPNPKYGVNVASTSFTNTSNTFTENNTKRKTMLIGAVIGAVIGAIIGIIIIGTIDYSFVFIWMWFGIGFGGNIDLVADIPDLFSLVYKKKGLLEAIKVATVGSLSWAIFLTILGPIGFLVRFFKNT